MVSYRNFFSIMLMMAIILFMFQFSQVIKESGSDYDVNQYVSVEKPEGIERWKPKVQTSSRDIKYAAGTFMVYFGKDDTDIYNTVDTWCNYNKYELVVRDDTDDYIINEQHLPRAVIVDSDTTDVEKSLDFYEKLAEYDVTIVFGNLPDPSVISGNEELMNFLGIREVWQEQVETEGIYLFSGFMLGGDNFYKLSPDEQLAEEESEKKRQDLELTMPWYLTAGGTKTYMVGVTEKLLEGREDKNEYYPAVIWRRNEGDCEIFSINGDYMNDMTGLGILSAIMYESDSYTLYPVINSQSISLVNFPGFAGENDKKMMDVYDRSTESLLRDICWPALVAVCNSNNYRPTCLMAPQFDYSDDIGPSSKEVDFYLQQFKEFNAEAGLSLKCMRGSSLGDKLAADESFYKGLNLRYVYTSAYVGEEELAGLRAESEKHGFLAPIRTVTGNFGRKEPIVSYFDNDMTVQNCVIDSDFHSYSDNMYLKSIETALGYTNVYLDMYKVMWPESEEDQWQNVSNEVISNLNTYLKIFNKFDKATLTESDAKIRNFLNLDYNEWRSGDVVRLDVKNGTDSCFMLRTHGEDISSISGASYTKIEDDSYLIYTKSRHIRIVLERYRGIPKYHVEGED